MRRSWAARLTATFAASQFYFSSTTAQNPSTIGSLIATTSTAQIGYTSIIGSALRSVTPTASQSVVQSGVQSLVSSTPTPTSSGEPTVHTIQAGAGGFKFTPQELHNVSVGDIVQWEFYPPDHSVARAEFGSACVPYEYTGKDKTGFWSETQWVNNTDEITYFNVTINSTEPIFFYCAAPNSCKGELMVGAINPNSTQTLASQVQAAAAADYQIAPGEAVPAEASSTLSSAPTATGAPPSYGGGGNGGSHSLSTGAIVGIVIGGVAFLAICAALFFFVGRSKSLKETIKRQDATTNHDATMSQQYGGSNYGHGGLASPGFTPSTPGYSTPPPGHRPEYGFSPPPGYGQHNVGEQYPSGWSSPGPHHGHMSMMSNVSGMSQQQMDQAKYAQMNSQPVAELHSPPLEQQSFSAELEAPGREKPRG